MKEKRRGGVTYRKADASYFERRRLRRFAGVWSLWALELRPELPSSALPRSHSFCSTSDSTRDIA